MISLNFPFSPTSIYSSINIHRQVFLSFLARILEFFRASVNKGWENNVVSINQGLKFSVLSVPMNSDDVRYCSLNLHPTFENDA